ncbi:MAG: hypothetical protein BGO98_49480 [Myxococcales bacterium 68-20]|nr:MAG: hypothetical protein BGO98_49480 [Myxococcales bacterium 68-20]
MARARSRGERARRGVCDDGGTCELEQEGGTTGSELINDPSRLPASVFPRSFAERRSSSRNAK